MVPAGFKLNLLNVAVTLRYGASVSSVQILHASELHCERSQCKFKRILLQCRLKKGLLQLLKVLVKCIYI